MVGRTHAVTNMKHVLILYIVEHSGHHAAARYLADALQAQAPGSDVRCVDLLKLTHPRWEKVIRRMYMLTVRRTPELWDALYDNFWVEFLSRRVRCMVQQGKSESLRKLMADFAPDAVICTQAFPFAVLASFVAREHDGLPLFAVTTDFVPHRFWITQNAHQAQYIVPTESAAARLMWLGIDRQRIHVMGIPVSVRCTAHASERPAVRDRRRVLVMGGGHGVGMCYRTICKLDRCPDDFTIDVVCGINRRLRQHLARNRHRFKHPLRIRGYVHNAVALMSRADILMTKAGGVTLAEAACVGVPILLVRSLPGQEKGNTAVMVHRGAALHVTNEYDVPRSVALMLGNPDLLAMMREKALAMAHPDAADRIAGLVLESIHKGETP